MTDRLRKLDALFAEKVLGRVFLDDGSGNLFEASDGHKGDALPHYTRSLDAAWWGAMYYLGHNVELWSLDFADSGGNEPTWTIRGGKVFKKDEDWEVEGEAEHPAEALVIACLRAVGEEVE
jgi:hypothetical protein